MALCSLLWRIASRVGGQCVIVFLTSFSLVGRVTEMLWVWMPVTLFITAARLDKSFNRFQVSHLYSEGSRVYGIGSVYCMDVISETDNCCSSAGGPRAQNLPSPWFRPFWQISWLMQGDHFTWNKKYFILYYPLQTDLFNCESTLAQLRLPSFSLAYTWYVHICYLCWKNRYCLTPFFYTSQLFPGLHPTMKSS